MKIRYLILLSLFLLIPLNTNALSFTDCNNISHNVDSAETLVDYNYFTYKYNNNYYPNAMACRFYFYSYDNTNRMQCLFSHDIDPVFIYQNSAHTRVAFWFYNSNNNLVSGNEVTIYNTLGCNNDFTSCYPGTPQSGTYMSNDGLMFYPNLYINSSNTLTLDLSSTSYTMDSIQQKYNCSSSPSPSPSPTDEEVSMFNVVETFLIQFINILPFIIPFILIMNLVCRMLFNERS